MTRWRQTPTASEYYSAGVNSGTILNFGSGTVKPVGPMSALALCMPIKVPPNGNCFIFSRCPSATSNGLRLVWSDNGASNNLWQCGFNSTGTAGAPSQSPVNFGTAVYRVWNHVAITWDGTLTASTGIAVYAQVKFGPLVLRAAATSTNGTTAADTNASNDFCIGGRAGDNLRTFEGYIAYVAMWDRVLSQTELLKAQLNGPLTIRNGLQLCWSCGRDYGPRHVTASKATGSPAFGGTRVQ